MTPTSLSLTESDIDLVDWLVLSGAALSRTDLVHLAVLAYGRAQGAPARLLRAAVREREERGVRRHSRVGTAALRRAGDGEDSSSTA